MAEFTPIYENFSSCDVAYFNKHFSFIFLTKLKLIPTLFLLVDTFQGYLLAEPLVYHYAIQILLEHSHISQQT